MDGLHAEQPSLDLGLRITDFLETAAGRADGTDEVGTSLPARLCFEETKLFQLMVDQLLGQDGIPKETATSLERSLGRLKSMATASRKGKWTTSSQIRAG